MTNINFTECLACGSKGLTEYMNLGLDQPLANNFTEEIKEWYKEGHREQHARYALKVEFCSNCSHSQLSYGVSPEVLYKDYCYVSGTTQTLKKHFRGLASYALLNIPKSFQGPKVLDIAANDGSLLEEFKVMGNSSTEVYGVDPASNLQIESFKKGLPVLVDFWSKDLGEKLQNNYDIITACNVFAHQRDPLGFLEGAREALKEDGIVVIEFPYYKNTVKTLDFGQIYFEHISYFTIKSFQTLANRALLEITNIQEFPEIHGGTIRFTLKKGISQKFAKHRILQEGAQGFHDLETYQDFAKFCNINLEKLRELLKKQDRKVIAYGASAKSSTLFNSPIGKEMVQYVDYIVDDAPLKVNKIAPGSNLRVKPTGDLPKECVILLTVHNFKDEVKKRLQAAGVHGKLINYVPRVEIEDI